MQSNLSPSRTDKPEHGRLTRTLLGGGDALYEMNTEEAIKQIQESDGLTLHHTIQNKRDFRQDLIISVLATLILVSVLSLLGVAALTEFFRIDRDTSRGILLYFAMPASVFFALRHGWTYIQEHPNYGWESHKTIDFVEGHVRIYSALFGKQPDERITVLPFNEIGLVCYVNDYWEQGPTIDLFLATKDDIKEAKNAQSCSYICNLCAGNPEKITHSRGTYTVTNKIPAEVLAVAQAFITRTGIEFFDYVSEKPTKRQLRESRARAQ